MGVGVIGGGGETGGVSNGLFAKLKYRQTFRCENFLIHDSSDRT